VGGCRLDLSASGWRTLSLSCENANEPHGSSECGEFLDKLSKENRLRGSNQVQPEATPQCQKLITVLLEAASSVVL
jgi:hypothetical protein